MMLRARDDRKERGFIYKSVAIRLAKIVRGVPGFEHVACALENESFCVSQLPKNDGGPDWTAYIAKEIDETITGNCMDVSWFFLENYIYRMILGKTGYFLPQSKQFKIDPWKASKEEALVSALPAFKLLCEQQSSPTLDQVLLCSLWGNRNDLSLSAGVVEAAHDAGKLLVNDIPKVEYAKGNGGVIIILDNCGAELLADIRLACHLLMNVPHVTLHCKAHPVFVSDALVSDVHWHIDQLVGTEFGALAKSMLQENRLRVFADEFYCSPLEYSQAPANLKQAYATSSLVIVKGDANYRRLFGDRPLPPDFPFNQVAKRITSTPLLAIRTCKSPVIVGITKQQFTEQEDEDWCVNGTVGVIQFSK